MKRDYVALALSLTSLVLLPIAAREPLAARIAHSDPSKYRDFARLFSRWKVAGRGGLP